jgi:hypothetical protein
MWPAGLCIPLQEGQVLSVGEAFFVRCTVRQGLGLRLVGIADTTGNSKLFQKLSVDSICTEMDLFTKVM